MGFDQMGRWKNNKACHRVVWIY